MTFKLTVVNLTNFLEHDDVEHYHFTDILQDQAVTYEMCNIKQ